MFSAGRRGFKHQTQERYLLVKTGKVHWSVRGSIESKKLVMKSGCAPSMCPADPRAQTRKLNGVTSQSSAQFINTVIPRRKHHQ